jgi:aryl-alcohol dehydrogenase-like predicted oxidoreductase
MLLSIRAFSFVDTAEGYTWWVPGNKGGESETLIGSWLRKNPAKRNKVMIATKCAVLSKDRIRRSVEGSLTRLNTDRIDLFQSHRDDKDVPLEETFRPTASLSRKGRSVTSELPITLSAIDGGS